MKINKETLDMISYMEKFENVRFVAWEEEDDGPFRQILGIDTNLYNLLGKSLVYIAFMNSYIESIDMAEGEEGIVIQYIYNNDEDNSPTPHWIFILWNKDDIKKGE